MDNKISLKDWFYQAHTTEEYQDLFYGLHKECHKLYNSYDSGVPYLDIRYSARLEEVLSQIKVNWMNNTDVTYLGATTIPLVQRSAVKENSINFLATLAVGTYLGFDYRNGLINKDLIASQFDNVKAFLPSDDVPYYEDVLLRNQYVFYDEWKKMQSLQGTTSNSGRGFQKRLGGVGPSVEADEDYSLNDAAFAQGAILGVMFFTVAISMIGLVLLLIK